MVSIMFFIILIGTISYTPLSGQVINAYLICGSSQKPFKSLEYYDSTFYATTENHIYHRFDMNYNMVIDSIAVGTSYPNIRRFVTGRDGNLYAQTDTFVMRKTPTGWVSTGFSPPMYAVISVDDQSNIWAWKTASYNPPTHHIYRFNGTTAIQYVNPLPTMAITWQNFVADDSGAVWIGTWNGLFRFTTTGYTHYFPGQVVGDMELDDQNRLYFACDSVLMIRDTSGFSVFNPNIHLDPSWPEGYTTKVHNNIFYVFQKNWTTTIYELLAVTPIGIQNVNQSGMHFCQDSTIKDLHFDPLGRYWLLGMASGDNGHIYVQDSTLSFSISGKVFLDLNWNGVFDAGDLPVQNVLVNNNFLGTTAFTDAQGDYQLTMPGLIGMNYYMDQILQPPLVLTTSPVNYTGLLFPGIPITNINFGYSTSTPLTNLDIHAFGFLSPMPPGFTSNAYFYVQNLSLNTVYNVEAWYVHDTVYNTPSSNVPPSLSGPDTLYWMIDSLLPLSWKMFHITLPMSPSVPIGTPVKLTFFVNHPIDTLQSNDTIHLFHTIQNSYDPNDKIVYPDRPENDIAADELLTYTVRFQNIGTGPAINVVIRDTLSTHLDLSTLNFKGASHNYSWHLNSGNELEIIFPNIYLPDSASFPEESVGAVSFTIKPLPGLAHGTEITNEAAIYFDFNPPIITSKTHSIIKDPNIGIPKHGHHELFVWPNPVNDFLWIKYPGFRSEEKVWVTIYDLQGRLIFRSDHTPEQQQIHILTHDLKPGYYIGTCVMTDHSAISFRMVKNE